MILKMTIEQKDNNGVLNKVEAIYVFENPSYPGSELGSELGSENDYNLNEEKDDDLTRVKIIFGGLTIGLILGILLTFFFHYL
jgi:hypothetical protein